MRKMTLSLLLVGLTSTAFASTTNEAWNDINANRDATINVYGVGAKINSNQDSSAGAGIMYDSEAVKVKLEGTSDFVKTGAVLKVNPFTPNLYFKFGLNYINQKVYSVVNTSTRVNQYSGSFATGYMLTDSFYAEVGGSYTKLIGKVFGDYEIVDEKTSLGYVELAKRWESAIGTIDTTANAGKVFHEFSDDEASYGAGVEYYPMDNTKLSYAYQYEKNNISNTYKAQYSYAFVEYNDNISNDTYKVTAGLAIAFDDITDFSTYRAPANIKSHLSELNRFENITFGTNMQIQSESGVKMTQAAKDRINGYTSDINIFNSSLQVLSYTDTTITIKAIDIESATIRNLEYKLYSDVDLNSLVSTNKTGVFTGLTQDKQYYIVYTAEVQNTDGTWESKVSQPLAVKTKVTPPPADTQAPVLVATNGNFDNNNPSFGNIVGDNTVTIDYTTLVSDNVTSDANMKIKILSKSAGLTISVSGLVVTYTGNDGTGTYTATFVCVDEAGNESVSFTQTIQNI